jgi:hypothetical protein
VHINARFGYLDQPNVAGVLQLAIAAGMSRWRKQLSSPRPGSRQMLLSTSAYLETAR